MNPAWCNSVCAAFTSEAKIANVAPGEFLMRVSMLVDSVNSVLFSKLVDSFCFFINHLLLNSKIIKTSIL